MMDDIDASRKVLLTILTALLGLLPAAFELLLNQRKSRSRGNRIAQLLTELEFLERWFSLLNTNWIDNKTQPLKSSRESSLQGDLNRLLMEYRNLRGIEQEEMKAVLELLKLTFSNGCC